MIKDKHGHFKSYETICQQIRYWITLLCITAVCLAFIWDSIASHSAVKGHAETHIQVIFIVVPCMLFQSLLYCSNSCTPLHFKTLKHLKFTPACFGLLWNHPQRVHGRTSLRYWIGMLIYICYIDWIIHISNGRILYYRMNWHTATYWHSL